MALILGACPKHVTTFDIINFNLMGVMGMTRGKHRELSTGYIYIELLIKPGSLLIQSITDDCKLKLVKCTCYSLLSYPGKPRDI